MLQIQHGAGNEEILSFNCISLLDWNLGPVEPFEYTELIVVLLCDEPGMTCALWVVLIQVAIWEWLCMHMGSSTGIKAVAFKQGFNEI